MNGMNRTTGKILSGIDHLKQSVTDVLTTPVGSRVMQRGYGSRLYQLLDTPLNAQSIVLIYAAVVEALSVWESRIRIDRVTTDSITPGAISVSIDGTYLPDGSQIKLSGITVS